ncbi:MAG: efflux RND transporter periplasmic adaptor subunit [Pseudomonadales bacterium]|nr:efflux RND transporter periplasmic adaptor subunit [Pseudomonadales bacterium]NIX09022.1 efflux RND transporter periplasmic adaptor subunit [Pseudomonadales bacterium]
MRTTYLTAGAIAISIVVWLLSGQIASGDPVRHPTLADSNAEARARTQDEAPTRVRARVMNASPQLQHVVLRGKTESKRIVEVRAETSGRVIERPVERGAYVTEGELLCRLSMDDRDAALAEAKESLNQARIEYEGSLKLQQKGFQSDTAIAQAKARLAAAEAKLARSSLDVSRTEIRAPFDGAVETVHQDVGDYVNVSAPCVTIVDLDPMLLVGRVAEKDVHRLRLDQHVTGLLSNGTTVTGPVTFIGQQSDPATRTYAVEIEVPNTARTIRSGITTEIRIPVAEIMAQKVSPAVFSLDDAGSIGVRVVNADYQVEFHSVNIIREAADGVWVSGLPDIATVITVGQELVVPGETVDVDFEPAEALPAAAPAERPVAPPAGADGRERVPSAANLTTQSSPAEALSRAT